MNKDYLRGYADGLADAEASAAYAERLRAFGAIRRVVRITRRYDKAEREMAAQNYHEAAGVYGRYAENVRRTIRAAIGSEKA